MFSNVKLTSGKFFIVIRWVVGAPEENQNMNYCWPSNFFTYAQKVNVEGYGLIYHDVFLPWVS